METSITLYWELFAIESRFGFRAKKHLHYFNCTLGEYFILVPYGVRLYARATMALVCRVSKLSREMGSVSICKLYLKMYRSLVCLGHASKSSLRL